MAMLTEQEKAQRLGAELFDYLSKHGFTKKVLLAKLRVSRTTLNGWMDGLVYPSLSNRQIIAHALGLTLDELHQKIGETDNLPVREIEEVIQTVKNCSIEEFVRIHKAVIDRANQELEDYSCTANPQSQVV